MLLSIHIKNYTLIEDLRLEFAPELNIFTGETGAGKSIIIESLGLLLGARSSAQVVRKGSNSCFITGEFDCSHLTEVRQFLDESGLGIAEENLMVRREIAANGKSRSFINDRPVSAETLKNLGEYLVDVHGQNDHQTLLKSSCQRALLDGFGNLASLVAQVSESYHALRSLVSQLQSQAMSAQERERLVELYSFQKKEIESAQLTPGEEEDIEKSLPIMKNAEKIQTVSDDAYHILYGEDEAVIEKLGKVQKLVESLNMLGGNLSETSENLRKAYSMVDDAAHEIESFRDRLNADPEVLNQLLERQNLIAKLKKKYGNSIQEILAYKDKISSELDALSSVDQNRQELEKNVEKARAALISLCEKLTAQRKKAAEKLSMGTEKELHELGMKKARFSISIEKEVEPTSEGQDRVEFLFCANPGEDAKPLKNIASGGEMSRVMLAIKTVLAKTDRIPALIFDEIDSGVGGPMGQVVGRKLKELSRHHQVLCITHLPQIAAFGTQHFYVEKETKGAQTLTCVRVLPQKERTDEIARMLSGEKITPSALIHAAELIKNSMQQI